MIPGLVQAGHHLVTLVDQIDHAPDINNSANKIAWKLGLGETMSMDRELLESQERCEHP